jgi:hypothetical protein
MADSRVCVGSFSAERINTTVILWATYCQQCRNVTWAKYLCVSTLFVTYTDIKWSGSRLSEMWVTLMYEWLFRCTASHPEFIYRPMKCNHVRWNGRSWREGNTVLTLVCEGTKGQRNQTLELSGLHCFSYLGVCSSKLDPEICYTYWRIMRFSAVF